MSCKHLAAEISPDELYLADSPHLTLYVGDFFINNGLLSAAADAGHLPLAARISGWESWLSDPVTGLDTLVLAISEESAALLRLLQKNLIAEASRQRRRPFISRYLEQKTFTADMKYSIQEWGYPFTGLFWKPHLTIASFRPDIYKKIMPLLLEKNPPHTVLFSEIALFEITPGKPKEIFRTGGSRHA
ncbi:MAG: hypothetical protein A2096_02275 [Spirochaetes bacterium GWF1_41_5]|nr:MAG: hypothetical protein A2096_02275 [Spirochaetes bacterium GWF1_41_5]